jgi:hypothetical protein
MDLAEADELIFAGQDVVSRYLPDEPPGKHLKLTEDALNALYELPENVTVGLWSVPKSFVDAAQRRAELLSVAFSPEQMEIWQRYRPQMVRPEQGAIPKGMPIQQPAPSRERQPLQPGAGPGGRPPGAIAAEALGVVARPYGEATQPIVEDILAPTGAALGRAAGRAAGHANTVSDAIGVRQNKVLEAQDHVTLKSAPITRLARGLIHGGLPSTAVAIGAGLVTGEPTIGLALFYEMTAGSSYAEMREKGFSEGEAGMWSSILGSIEVAGESLVLPSFIKGLTEGIPLTNAFLLMAENFGQEAVTEGAQAFWTEFATARKDGATLAEAVEVGWAAAERVWLEAGLIGAGTAGVIDVASLPATIYQTRRQRMDQTQVEGQPFVEAPDGGIDFGVIDAQRAEAARVPEAPIRLRQGTRRGGAQHIEERHGRQIHAMGFATIEDFVADVAAGYDQIWMIEEGPSAGRLALIKHADERHLEVVELMPSRRGDFYDVVTAYPPTTNYKIKGSLLWDSGKESAGLDRSGTLPVASGPSRAETRPPRMPGSEQQAFTGSITGPEGVVKGEVEEGRPSAPVATDIVRPQLYIGNVTARAKGVWAEVFSEATGQELAPEDVHGHLEAGWPTKRTAIPMRRDKATAYLQWLVDDINNALDNNLITPSGGTSRRCGTCWVWSRHRRPIGSCAGANIWWWRSPTCASASRSPCKD